MQHSDLQDWWKNGVVYHIYPNSFKDSNNDGIGDIPGIIKKLDYLAGLGVDAIWLSPIYPSPMVDVGYDIADYKSIDDQYGTMDDFKNLLGEAHKRGIRIIMDLVLNHTSDLHPWFLESRSSKNSPKRDWYIWRPPKDGKKGKKPNNWKTNFGKKAWRYDHKTREYYYHSFFWQQPDLNWRNPEVKKAMFDIMRYWLDMGIDGFRLDVINLIYKDPELKDNKFSLFGKSKIHNRNHPEAYDLLKDFRKLLDSYPEKTSVGEIYVQPPGDPALATSFLGSGTDMLHLVFDFSLVFTLWRASGYYKTITNYYQNIPESGWPCFFLSNHDIGRSIKRLLWERNKYAKAKLHAVLLLTLKGTPFIYYGDEIGMENVSIPKHHIRDLYGRLLYPFFGGRDRARTPMQWSDKPNAGFSKQTPWLPVSENYTAINVKTDGASILSIYKALLALRKQYETLQKGDITFLDKGENNVLAYSRKHGQEEIIVLLNFSNRKKRYSQSLGNAEILFSTHGTTKLDGKATLQAFEGVVLLYPKRGFQKIKIL
ncbi:MAG: alpha-glucosidase [Fibromonadaceae bacterium]|jgi:alpha-glucosidase|nr:alpha-glucosidase [Fibromonadaceae bacterium]